MNRLARGRIARAALALSALAGLAATACISEAPPGAVHVLTVDGTVNGVLERYIDRGITRAEREEAAAVVLLVKTPGGAIGAMRDIVGRIEEATVPVITYVHPPGAQAASAGTFIVMAGHVAAMAPNTTIGAASPVTGTGEDIEGTLGKKVENDTIAFARGVAELRGRDADWAEDAVREARSAAPSEAVALRVVDYEAPSLEALLAAADGDRVELLDGRVVELAVAEAVLVFNNRNVYERVLTVLSDPLVVSILILVGLAGLAFEFFNPGLYFPAILGVTATIASFLGVGTLLPGEAAAAFIVFGIALVVLEWFVPSGGAFGTGGAIAVVLGLSILLGQGSTELDARRVLTVIAVAAVALTLLLGAVFVLLSRGFWSRQERPDAAAGS